MFQRVNPGIVGKFKVCSSREAHGASIEVSGVGSGVMKRCDTWDSWLAVVEEEAKPCPCDEDDGEALWVENEPIPSVEEDDEADAVPPVMRKSLTSGNLRGAASFVKLGLSSDKEEDRLVALLSNSTGYKPLDSQDRKAQRKHLVEGLRALADAHQKESVVARAALERGLVAPDTRTFRRQSAERTAKLCRALSARVQDGVVDGPRMCRLLDAAGFEGDAPVRDRLADLERCCRHQTLSQAELLQLKHVLHLTFVSLFRDDDDDDLKDSWWWRSLSFGVATGGRRSFEVRDWSNIAHLVQAYEAPSAPLRGARLEATPRVWCCSDLHVDCPPNFAWLENMAPRPHDTLLVAGDVVTQLDKLRDALLILTGKFRHVFYVPGNHELWLSDKFETSVHKFFAILQLCDDLGVHTSPAFVGDGLLVAPLFSWYRRHGASHAGALERFDGSCRWPFKNCASSLDNRIADFFLALNDQALHWIRANTRPTTAVISLSHFVPHVTDLFPGFLALRHIMGCQDLDRQLETLKPRVHVFGHSHINVDELIGTTRFVQQALGHPSDHNADPDNFRPLLIWAAETNHHAQ